MGVLAVSSARHWRMRQAAEQAESDTALSLQLTGTIPIAWGSNGSLPVLDTIALYQNHGLHGTLPAGFANMPLQRLDVNNTQLCNPGTATAQPAGGTAAYVASLTAQLPFCETPGLPRLALTRLSVHHAQCGVV